MSESSRSASNHLFVGLLLIVAMAAGCRSRESVTPTTGLNLRDAPTTSGSRVLTVVREGDVLAVLSRGEGWIQVRTSGGTEGWVSERFVAPLDQSDPSSAPQHGPGRRIRSLDVDMTAVGEALRGLAVLFNVLFNLTVVVYFASMLRIHTGQAVAIGLVCALGAAGMSPPRIVEANLLLGTLSLSVGGALMGGIGIGRLSGDGNGAATVIGLGSPLLGALSTFMPGLFDLYVVYLAMTIVGMFTTSSDVMGMVEDFVQNTDAFRLAWATSIFIGVFASLYGAAVWWPLPLAQAAFGLVGFLVGRAE